MKFLKTEIENQIIDINATDTLSRTALMKAVINGNIECVKYHIKLGCNVNHVDILGDTVLSIAVEEGNVEIVKLLVENHADITYKNFQRKNIIQLVEELIRNSTDYNLNKDYQQILKLLKNSKQYKNLLR